MNKASKQNNHPPWEHKRVPINIRIISILIILISWAIILYSTITLLSGVIGIDASQGPVAIPIIVRFIFLPLGMLILGIYLWANYRKYAFKPPDFRPVVIHDSSKIGEPFEVRVSKPFSGKGKLKFTGQGILFEAIPDKNGGGDLGSSSGIENLVFVAVFLAAYYLVSWVITRDTTTFLLIPYASIQQFDVAVRDVRLRHRAGEPMNLKFRISSSDGERFYRELNQHLVNP